MIKLDVGKLVKKFLQDKNNNMENIFPLTSTEGCDEVEAKLKVDSDGTFRSALVSTYLIIGK